MTKQYPEKTFNRELFMTDEKVLLFSYPPHSRQLQDSLMKEFLDKIIAYSKRRSTIINILVITLALKYVIQYQADQKRHSGESYYHHPIQVALIAAKLSCKTEIIAASLLHDIVEDTDITIDQIQFLFGSKIAELVNKLTKLDDIITKKVKIEGEHALQKLLQPEDMDAWYIKLADRLHNMQTLHHIESIEKQKRIALDTLNNFIPLAKLVRVKWIEQKL
ncbi:HD domain-containing protein [Rickettsia endosymbiont of Culicoides newsteadi]|uniref:HD domain-containing protein n=1 Tax=Rickettsia endosymbiont of Culicoides newsteadi TaxID=1961830 RepID=UPI000B9C06D6|nr:HD domain-containing protein [Rickettsia endosymbiont of Culicoides newsteadi]